MSTNPKRWRDYVDPTSVDELLSTDIVGPERTWIEVNFYCWWQKGYIAEQARHEQEVMGRTPEGQIKLNEILQRLQEVEKQNQKMIDELSVRLMLPKKEG